MFEKSFIELLAGDSALTALVSTYEGAPAVFSNRAPQKAEGIYIVFRIDRFDTENLLVGGFDLYVNIYTRGPSLEDVREVAERIEFIADREVITGDTRFDSIRLFYAGGNEIEEKDAKVQRYQCKLEARGTRKKWAGEVT